MVKSILISSALLSGAGFGATLVSADDSGKFGLGREATPAEVAAWDIDIRPDGQGLPVGSGNVLDGEELYTNACAVCHGDFGEGVGRWPVLAGGHDTLTHERPEKTIGSYWPYLSTVYDYVRRAMPYGDARSLSDDDVYAITAYLLYLNDIVLDEDFVLSNENFLEIRLPNERNFTPDDRDQEPFYAAKTEPCMTDCKDGPVQITMRARILDVTPGTVDDDAAAGVGGVD
ncbi:cytochrome c [Roseibium aquae]|uniref:Cytochrome c n=1 Tax=Roseibium aquae TaxID=1323746 RepID=A0A916TM97_9HYPH|nr:cytochrome c [Roseibium aquae]